MKQSSLRLPLPHLSVVSVWSWLWRFSVIYGKISGIWIMGSGLSWTNKNDACECEYKSMFWPPDSPVLCLLSLQGDAGPPGAEGEQGQEGVRVSDCKQPTNPFLPHVWVNITRSSVYPPSILTRMSNSLDWRQQNDGIVFVWQTLYNKALGLLKSHFSFLPTDADSTFFNNIA